MRGRGARGGKEDFGVAECHNGVHGAAGRGGEGHERRLRTAPRHDWRSVCEQGLRTGAIRTSHLCTPPAPAAPPRPRQGGAASCYRRQHRHQQQSDPHQRQHRRPSSPPRTYECSSVRPVTRTVTVGTRLSWHGAPYHEQGRRHHREVDVRQFLARPRGRAGVSHVVAQGLATWSRRG